MKNHRHILAGIAAALAVCTGMTAMSLSAAPGGNRPGDIDGDGAVGMTDIVLLQKYLLCVEELTFDQCMTADVYRDNVVDIFDLGKLKRMVVNGETVQPPQPPTDQPTEPSTEATEPSTVATEPTTEATEPTTEATEPTAPTEVSEETVVASVVINGSSVTLYDANGAVIAPSAATNVTVDGAYVTVTKSGEIAFSGTSTNGQIKVETDNTAEPEAIVTLSFEGLDLSNSTVAPVYIENVGDSATISVKKDTVNTISDGTTHTDTYVNSDNETVTVNGAIYAKDDLKIKGKGTLTVNGNYEDGIVCKDDLKIWNGTIIVNAVDDGIRGNDSVRIGDPDDLVANGGTGDYSNLNITVNTNNGSTGGDGIKSTSTDDSKGYITINGGTININSYADGIQAEQALTVNGGDITIKTFQGSTYTGSGTSTGGSTWGGGWGGPGGGMQEGNSNKTDVSAKGMKVVGLYDAAGTTWQSGGDLTINAGTISIDSSDDSLHCGGSMYLNGGKLTLASADDGAHSDHDLTIGTTGAANDSIYIEVTKSYEGIEGMNITQNAGTVIVTSSDDAYNAAGGSDGSGTGNTGGPGAGWGQGSMGGNTGNYSLTVNGGVIYANASGDGLDSNGAMTYNGGFVFVSQTGGGNSPLDCGDGIEITYNGGVVIAGGSSDMFSESVASTKTMSTTSAGLSAGSVVTVTDQSGKVLGSMTFANAAQALVVYGGSTVYSGGTVSGSTSLVAASTDQNMKASTGGTISGGTQIQDGGSSGGNWGW